ncbi:sugar phosphate isomerase/epimerase family protein [Chloroflexota bacterium]
MSRPITLFTGQWADLPFESICAKAQSFGYDGIEIACSGDHFDVDLALNEDAYIRSRREILDKYELDVYAISNHLVGQAICDRIDERHKGILPARVWGNGKEDGVRSRAIEEMKNTAWAAAKLGIEIVSGFTGSPIWHLAYPFPPVPSDMIEDGYRFFAELWNPILDVFDQAGVRFALEVHPTEIAFDIASTEKSLKVLNNRIAFGFNYDPSHFGYQGVDYVSFIYKFSDRIYHAHMKDVYWSKESAEAGVFGGNLEFGDRRRFWDFRSLGRGSINFEEIIRALNEIGYTGPLSVEWEDNGMDREHGAAEACAFLHKIDFPPSERLFEASLSSKK